MAPLATLLALLLLGSGSPFGKKRWGPNPAPGPRPITIPRIETPESLAQRGKERAALEAKLPALFDLLKEGSLGAALLGSFDGLPTIRLANDAGAYVAYFSFEQDLIGVSHEACRESLSRSRLSGLSLDERVFALLRSASPSTYHELWHRRQRNALPLDKIRGYGIPLEIEVDALVAEAAFMEAEIAARPEHWKRWRQDPVAGFHLDKYIGAVSRPFAQARAALEKFYRGQNSSYLSLSDIRRDSRCYPGSFERQSPEAAARACAVLDELEKHFDAAFKAAAEEWDKKAPGRLAAALALYEGADLLELGELRSTLGEPSSMPPQTAKAVQDAMARLAASAVAVEAKRLAETKLLDLKVSEAVQSLDQPWTPAQPRLVAGDPHPDAVHQHSELAQRWRRLELDAASYKAELGTDARRSRDEAYRAVIADAATYPADHYLDHYAKAVGAVIEDWLALGFVHKAGQRRYYCIKSEYDKRDPRYNQVKLYLKASRDAPAKSWLTAKNEISFQPEAGEERDYALFVPMSPSSYRSDRQNEWSFQPGYDERRPAPSPR